MHAAVCLLSVCRPIFLFFFLHPHTSLRRRGSKVKISGELQRGGEKGKEDLVGGERAGAEEEPGKEALLRGTETPAPHCGRRRQVTARWN